MLKLSKTVLILCLMSLPVSTNLLAHSEQPASEVSLTKRLPYCSNYEVDSEEKKFRNHISEIKYIFIHGISGEHSKDTIEENKIAIEKEKQYIEEALGLPPNSVYYYDYYARFSSCSPYARTHRSKEMLGSQLHNTFLDLDMKGKDFKSIIESADKSVIIHPLLKWLTRKENNFFQSRFVDIMSYYDDLDIRTSLIQDLSDKINQIQERNPALTLIAHSLGTGITYDTLRLGNIQKKGNIRLITLGSQIGRGKISLKAPGGFSVFNYAPLKPVPASQLGVESWIDLYGRKDPTAFSFWRLGSQPISKTIFDRPITDRQFNPRYVDHSLRAEKRATKRGATEVIDYITAIKYCVYASTPSKECYPRQTPNLK